MAQAARDPIFRASLAIANQDIAGVGEYCLRCHAPTGWMAGRSTAADGSSLTEKDMHGVSCDLCHRLVDPKGKEAKGLVKDVPPGYGSGMMVLTGNKRALGPYDDSPPVKSHKTEKSVYHASGHLCGTCHDVSNPLFAKDVKTQPPEAYGTIERTYSEWLLSAYAKGPEERTCQSCHYPQVKGGGKASRQADSPHRDYFVKHGPVGASIWMQEAVLSVWGPGEVDEEALKHGTERAKALLKTAARLDLTFGPENKATLRVTNLTGHKLPTGYIEGRRMWVHVRFLDKAGKVLKEVGQYEEAEMTIAGEAIRARTLVHPDKTRVYEGLPGMSIEQAKKHNKKPGKSFHFVLNDVITFDNRIPPKGFENAAFASRNCQPVGVTYADGQYWDDMPLELPEGCKQVEAELIFEPVTADYIKFLVEENRTDDWGRKLLKVWKEAGDKTAEIIAEVTAAVPQ